MINRWSALLLIDQLINRAFRALVCMYSTSDCSCVLGLWTGIVVVVVGFHRYFMIHYCPQPMGDGRDTVSANSASSSLHGVFKGRGHAQSWSGYGLLHIQLHRCLPTCAWARNCSSAWRAASLLTEPLHTPPPLPPFGNVQCVLIRESTSAPG